MTAFPSCFPQNKIINAMTNNSCKTQLHPQGEHFTPSCGTLNTPKDFSNNKLGQLTPIILSTQETQIKMMEV
jgi:hypothetical protein